MKTWALLLTMIATPAAWGQAGSGESNASNSEVKSMNGFCTDADSTTDPEVTGLCQSLSEQFQKNDCLKETVEKLRKRFIGKGDKDKDGNRIGVAFDFQCSAKPPAEGSLRTLAEKDPSKFSLVLMQWIAMLINQHSNWDVEKTLKVGGPKGPSGLLGLTLGDGGDKDMDNPKYACACKDKVATTEGQSNVSFAGQSPGPLDSHHTVICGAYMILKSLEDDQSSGGSSAKGTKPENKPKGAAKILKELETVDPKDKKAVAQEEWRTDKMKTYCDKFWGGGATNKWSGPSLKDIGGDQLKGSTTK